MAESQARERLLDAAVAQALESGIADLSLRELAAAIGTSHRMLIYHFGSREGLLIAVAQAVEQTQRDLVFGDGAEPASAADARRILEADQRAEAAAAGATVLRALRARVAPATRDRGFLDDIVESWVAPIAAAAVATGVDQRTARADARLSLAVVRGLILDLLATGDRKGVTEAFERYLDLALG